MGKNMDKDLISIKNLNKAIPIISITIFSYVLTIVFDRLNAIYSNAIVIPLYILGTLVISYILGILMKKISPKIKMKKSNRNINSCINNISFSLYTHCKTI